MHEQARANRKSPLYIYEYYNVFDFWKTPVTGSCRVIGRMINALIEGLNKGRQLPRFLVIIIDKDIIKDVGIYDYGAAKEIMDNMSWLAKQIDVLIQRRKTELTDAKPGALYSTDPKVIFVTMLLRPLQFPKGSQMSNVISLRSKFNTALNDIAYASDYSIMSIDACNNENHFHLMGNLSQFGEFTFWKQLNHLLSMFDKKKVELVPTHRCSLSAHRHGSGDHTFHK